MGFRTTILKAVKLFPLASPSHPLYAHACLWPLWFQLCCGCVHPPAEPGNSCMFALSRTCMGGVSCCCMRRGQSLAVTLAAGEVLLPNRDSFLPSLLQSRNFCVVNVRISHGEDVISCIWLCPFKFYVLECIAAKSVCTDAECCSWFIEGKDSTQRPRDRLQEWACANLMKFSRANCKVLCLELEQSLISVQAGGWTDWEQSSREGPALGHEKPDMRQKCVHAASDRQWHN